MQLVFLLFVYSSPFIIWCASYVFWLVFVFLLRYSHLVWSPTLLSLNCGRGGAIFICISLQLNSLVKAHLPHESFIHPFLSSVNVHCILDFWSCTDFIATMSLSNWDLVTASSAELLLSPLLVIAKIVGLSWPNIEKAKVIGTAETDKENFAGNEWASDSGYKIKLSSSFAKLLEFPLQ